MDLQFEFMSEPIAYVSQVTMQIPSHAKQAVMQVTQAPWVLLDGAPAQLAPGARIRNPQFSLVLSASLTGQQWLIQYTLNTLGQIQDVWLIQLSA